MTIECKVCKGTATHWGTSLSNKSLVPLGYDVEYYKCQSCGFVNTDHFDTWTKEDFAKHIYNDKYIVVDPEYDGTRSRRDAQWFFRACPNTKELSILDYGCGDGHFVNELNKNGFKAQGWDTMLNMPKPTEKFDLITSFEVFEHTPVPLETLEEILGFLKPNGRILISTYVNNAIPPLANPAEFWYIAPRNGHVCMHSFASLDYLFGLYGMKVTHHGDAVHEAYFP